MKLNWKIWLLLITLIISFLSIINVSKNTTLLLLVLSISILFVLTSVKSKFGKILILILLISAGSFMVYQQTLSGLMVKSVTMDSLSYEQGIRPGQIILEINSNPIKTLLDYSNALDSEFPSTTNKKLTILTDKGEFIIFTNEAPKIILEEIPKTRIKLGLDLEGGSRALVKPDQEINAEELNELISITSNRLNIYGLSDLTIRPISDLSGNNYMLIEIAGASPAELEELISSQGKFEARIGNKTVFSGGEDIAHVERAGQTAGIESCFPSQDGGEICKFRFPISLIESAAQKHADITSELGLSSENSLYLSEKLMLYVDDVLMDELFISKDLKGIVTTQIAIQGSGTGNTRQEAVLSAQQNMNKLQTILITGSLPYKLEIVKLDTISPLLGIKFINTIFLAGLAALLAVAGIVLLRYRNLKLSLALLFTAFSEIFIIIGIAAIIRWNLDLPAIAGIIATIGTGVDQQIIILDESKTGKMLSIKERLKRAMFIILGSFLTTFFAMIPLLFAGAGLLKGFAITTMIGITMGILVTRPAFAEMVKKIVD